MTVHFLAGLYPRYESETKLIPAFPRRSSVGVCCRFIHRCKLPLPPRNLKQCSSVKSHIAKLSFPDTCAGKRLGTGCYCGGCIGILETAAASQAIYKHYWRGGKTPSRTSAHGLECRHVWRYALCHYLMFEKYATRIQCATGYLFLEKFNMDD